MEFKNRMNPILVKAAKNRKRMHARMTMKTPAKTALYLTIRQIKPFLWVKTTKMSLAKKE